MLWRTKATVSRRQACHTEEKWGLCEVINDVFMAPLPSREPTAAMELRTPTAPMLKDPDRKMLHNTHASRHNNTSPEDRNVCSGVPVHAFFLVQMNPDCLKWLVILYLSVVRVFMQVVSGRPIVSFSLSFFPQDGHKAPITLWAYTDYSYS